MSRRRTYEHAGEEPDLLDLLADPVIHAVMRRDGVTLADLCAVIQAGSDRLRTSGGTVVMLPPPVGWPDWPRPGDGGFLRHALSHA
jgi:hypothetical protein